MRKIITTTFVTLDGVMPAPVGPIEEVYGSFAYGNWPVDYWDTMMGTAMSGFMAIPFELLLCKRTYDLFAAHWPYSKQEPIAGTFNRTRKYVFSPKPEELSWHNSTLITGDVIGEVKKLKGQNGPDLWVHGSGHLLQTLLKKQLIDRMHIWTFPVTVGSGKRLFAEGIPARDFKLIDSRISTTGVIIATYEVAEPLKSISSALEPHSEAELANIGPQI